MGYYPGACHLVFTTYADWSWEMSLFHKARWQGFCRFSKCRVEAVQQALVSFTGIEVEEQIAIYAGAKLDPSKSLKAYGLPKVGPSTADTCLLSRQLIQLVMSMQLTFYSGIHHVMLLPTGLSGGAACNT